jgi:hypothetical protein
MINTLPLGTYIRAAAPRGYITDVPSDPLGNSEPSQIIAYARFGANSEEGYIILRDDGWRLRYPGGIIITALLPEYADTNVGVYWVPKGNVVECCPQCKEIHG